MNFHRYMTNWDRMPQQEKKRHGKFDSFYKAFFAQAMKDGVYLQLEAELIAEYNWIVCGRPYYKVWPEYAISLSNTKLNVPMSAFKLPHFSFAVFLPALNPPMFTFPHQGRTLEMRSMLVHGNISQQHAVPVWSVVIDDGEERRSHITMHLTKDTVQECYESIPDERLADEDETSHELTKAAVQMSLAVSLLAVSSHRCVEHDVLERLRERYDAAKTDGEREALADKSRRNGVNGYRIGRSLSLQTIHEDREANPTDRHLRWQHIRGGHFHTVLKGWGRSERVVQWFEPTIVRRDLPVKPIG